MFDKNYQFKIFFIIITKDVLNEYVKSQKFNQNKIIKTKQEKNLIKITVF